MIKTKGYKVEVRRGTDIIVLDSYLIDIPKRGEICLIPEYFDDSLYKSLTYGVSRPLGILRPLNLRFKKDRKNIKKSIIELMVYGMFDIFNPCKYMELENAMFGKIKKFTENEIEKNVDCVFMSSININPNASFKLKVKSYKKTLIDGQLRMIITLIEQDELRIGFSLSSPENSKYNVDIIAEPIVFENQWQRRTFIKSEVLKRIENFVVREYMRLEKYKNKTIKEFYLKMYKYVDEAFKSSSTIDEVFINLCENVEFKNSKNFKVLVTDPDGNVKEYTIE